MDDSLRGDFKTTVTQQYLNNVGQSWSRGNSWITPTLYWLDVHA